MLEAYLEVVTFAYMFLLGVAVGFIGYVLYSIRDWRWE
jgi:hypothetical protein